MPEERSQQRTVRSRGLRYGGLMSYMVTTLRRSLWVLLVGAAGGIGWAWWRDRTAPPTPTGPPVWPPLEPPTSAPAPIEDVPTAISDVPDSKAPDPVLDWTMSVRTMSVRTMPVRTMSVR